MTAPTKLNTGNSRPVTSFEVLNAENPQVEREQLNRILKELSTRTGGTPGADGAQGPRGPAGADGADGAPGTPIPTGTSFPGSPSTNEMFFRTDRGLLYYYDGTRWLTVSQYRAGEIDLNNTSVTAFSAPRVAPTGMFINDIYTTAFVNGTNTGAVYWTINLQWATAANVYTSLSTASTQSLAGSTWLDFTTTVNAPLDATAKVLRILATETGSAGNLLTSVGYTYRLIG